MTQRYAEPFQTALDESGQIIAGAKLETFEAGTSTPLAVFSDEDLTTPHTNPVIADSAGRFPDIFLAKDKYKFVLKDSADVIIRTSDNYDNESLVTSDQPNNFTDDITMTGAVINEAQGTDIASAATTDIGGADGNYINITGTTTITALGTAQAGAERTVRFLGSLILTHNATSLILPTQSNITTAADDVVKFRSLGSGNWICVNYEKADGSALVSSPTSTLLQGYINGLDISNNSTDSDHDIDVATGVARDSTDSENLSLTSGLIKQIDANWSAGTNQGGFPSGLTLTADTWYQFFVIRRSSDGNVDAGFDTDSSATNLLADATGYVEFRRIGWVRTDASSNIEQFTKTGDLFIWDEIKDDVDAALSAVSTNFVLTSPPSLVSYFIALLNSGANEEIIIRDPDTPDIAPADATLNFRFAGATASDAMGTYFLRLNSSSEIALRAQSATVTFKIRTQGWIDKREV